MNYRNRKLLDLARGQPCANCGADDGTIVAAHSNLMRHGKGKSIKAHDCFMAFLCHRCHTWLDQGTDADPTGVYLATRQDKSEMFSKARDVTTLQLWTAGKIKVAA